MEKRVLDVAVISDVHLGTYACRAAECLAYLRSIAPRVLILNGDIMDCWQFSKHYFPADHMMVIQAILDMMTAGTRVIYITGNHDEALRRYSDLQIGNLQLTDKALIEINGKITWIFHGDVFDHTSKGGAHFISKLGSNGYAMLLGFNSFINRISVMLGRKKTSLAQTVMTQFNKRFVKTERFEQMIAEVAASKNYDAVICGHIHQPNKREIEVDGKMVTYLNSGDWVENMTSLEHFDGEWHLAVFPEELRSAVKTVREKKEAIVVPGGMAWTLQSIVNNGYKTAPNPL